MSLRWRIALALGAVAALVGAFAAVGSYYTATDEMVSSIDDSLAARSAEANAGDDRREPRRDDESDRCPPAGLFQPASAAQIVASSGTVTVCIAGGPLLPIDDRDRELFVRPGAARTRNVTIDATRYRLLTTARSDRTLLQVARSLDEVESVRATMRARLALLTALGVLAASLIGWLIARRIVRPITRLRDTAESIARTQDLATPITIEGRDETASLSASFAAMVTALATSREQQQRLIVDASHEMRTPLTSLRTNLDMLKVFDQLSPTDRLDLLAAVRSDAVDLSELFAELVELATDPVTGDERPDRISLADVAHEVAATASRRARRQIDVLVDETQDSGVLASHVKIERALANLVDNALKYSAADQPIEVIVTGTEVAVRDHGGGIADPDLPHIFDRFYRSAIARSEPGSGLGLAIVKQIVEHRGGRVHAANHAEGGAVVGFTLPPAPPAAPADQSP